MTYKELYELCRRIMGDALGRDFVIENERPTKCDLAEPFNEMRVCIHYEHAHVANVQTQIDTFDVRFIEEDDDYGNIGFMVTRFGGDSQGSSGFAGDFPFDDAPDELFFVREDDGNMINALSDHFGSDPTLEDIIETDVIREWIMLQKLRLA